MRTSTAMLWLTTLGLASAGTGQPGDAPGHDNGTAVYDSKRNRLLPFAGGRGKFNRAWGLRPHQW